MGKPTKQFWNFIVNAATATTPESVELRIDGEILDDDWVWLYDWFGIPNATPNKFRNELAKHAGKNITVWINSDGGSLFAGMGIYDALMEHKKSGAEITAIAQKAMSAASFPLMAADKKLITAGGAVMVHNPLTMMDGYGYAADFRKLADLLDEVKEAILNVYEQGTGLDRARLSEVMDNETIMSAHTAIEQGFVDGVYSPIESKTLQVKNQSDGVGFTFSRLVIQNSAKASMTKIVEILANKDGGQLKIPLDNKQAGPVVNTKIKEEKPVEIKNTDDLRKAHPELVAEIENQAKETGAQDERNRIKDIEAIAKNIDPSLVAKAKFEEPKNAKDLAFDALQASAVKGKEYLDQTIADNKASGAQDVKAAGDEGGAEPPTNIGDKLKVIAGQLDARRRGLK